MSNRSVRATLATATGCVLAVLAVSAPAEAKYHSCKPHNTLPGYRFVTQGDSCGAAALILYDLVTPYQESEALRMYREGTRTYRLPRHGTNYRKGQDYICTLTIRVSESKAAGHPVGRASGRCIYAPRPFVRFRFKSGAYA